MEVKLMEANPLVEETRNQVAVKRGPIVYCLESVDLKNKQDVFNVLLSANTELTPEEVRIDGTHVIALKGKATFTNDGNWKNHLYKEVQRSQPNTVPVILVPYFTWGNRGHSEMTVWLPFSR
jgi:uncharacterized protein